MGNDHYPIHTQQRRATILGIIHPLGDPAQSRHKQQQTRQSQQQAGSHQHNAELVQPATCQLILHIVCQKRDQPLGQLDHHVACKTIGNDDVGNPLGHIRALGIAHKVQPALLEQGKRRAHDLVPLVRFLAIRDDCHAWTRDTPQLLDIDRPHSRKLHHVLWVRVGVGPIIDEQHRTGRRGIGHG